jgi:Fe-S-cluster containining protein
VSSPSSPPQDRVTITFPTAAGSIDLDVGVPRGDLRLADIVPLAAQITDITVRLAIEAEEQAGRKLSCKAGCGACCRQLVPISAPEAFVLADWIVGMDDAERDTILERFDSALRQLDERGMKTVIDQILEDCTSLDPDGLAPAYFDVKVACPFLVEESCGAYLHRPVICRDFNVTSPAEWCSKPRLHVIKKIETPRAASYPLARVTARLTGEKLRLVPLPLALEYAEANIELAHRRWPARQLFETFMEELDRNQRD